MVDVRALPKTDLNLWDQTDGEEFHKEAAPLQKCDITQKKAQSLNRFNRLIPVVRRHSHSSACTKSSSNQSANVDQPGARLRA